MSERLLSVSQVLAHPELAVLHALAAALDATHRALLAAHPELEHEDFEGARPLELEPAGWLADSVLTHINGLEVSIRRYQQEVRRASAHRELDDIAF